MTTAPVEGRRRPTVSRLLAAELRAEMGRQGLTKRDLAARLNTTDMWVGRRLSPSSTVQITLEDLVAMAEALNLSVEGLMLSVLPRLDSNQQPSGYLSWLVRRVRARLFGPRRCSSCGRLHGSEDACGELAEVVELAAYRTRVAS